MHDIVPLKPPEFANLADKVKNNCVAVDYFRKNLFTATIRNSRDLKRKKTIFDNGEMSIKVDRSLNQRHRDLFSILMYEEKSPIRPDGSFYIRTKLYQLAKKMNYKTPNKATSRVYEMIIDMSKTMLYINQNNKVYNHTILGDGYYDRENDTYIIEIPAKTAKYLIYTYAVSIPKEVNEKIVAIHDSKIKALLSFMLANKKFSNGIKFDTICEKLEITNRSSKSKFKKSVIENENLLKDFKITFKEDTFFLEEQLVKFYHSLTDNEVDRHQEKIEILETKEKIKSQDISSLIGCKINIQNKFYLVENIELEKDVKAQNYNCYNIYIKNSECKAIMRTNYMTEYSVLEYVESLIK